MPDAVNFVWNFVGARIIATPEKRREWRRLVGLMPTGFVKILWRDRSCHHFCEKLPKNMGEGVVCLRCCYVPGMRRSRFLKKLGRRGSSDSCLMVFVRFDVIYGREPAGVSPQLYVGQAEPDGGAEKEVCHTRYPAVGGTHQTPGARPLHPAGNEHLEVRSYRLCPREFESRRRRRCGGRLVLVLDRFGQARP